MDRGGAGRWVALVSFSRYCIVPAMSDVTAAFLSGKVILNLAQQTPQPFDRPLPRAWQQPLQLREHQLDRI